MNGAFTFEHQARPWTVNAERGMHHQQRARLVREWREAFAWLAIARKCPRLRTATVTVQPWQRTASSMADVGACMPAAKAAIDGLVDAGVLADDDPEHLTALTFLPPLVGRDALVITIAGQLESIRPADPRRSA